MKLNIKLTKPVYRLSEAAKLLGLPVSKLRYDIADGILDARKVGKLIYVAADKFKEYAELYGIECIIESNEFSEKKGGDE